MSGHRRARQADGRIPLTPPGTRSGDASELAAVFIDLSRRYLLEGFLPRIRVALEHLEDSDLWWRPNEESNSAGNLVLHLCGNARQWIVAGIGGKPDVRRRQDEFDTRGGVSRAELTALIMRTFTDVDRELSAVSPAVLMEGRVIQGQRVSVLEAILHVVEHVSHHMGQLLWIAKARSGTDLGLWRIDDGVATPQWPKPDP